jgi:hypothetical protein
MTIQELIDYHDKQAIHFEPFGPTNALTRFHREAVETLKTAVAGACEACACPCHQWSDDDEDY